MNGVRTEGSLGFQVQTKGTSGKQIAALVAAVVVTAFASVATLMLATVATLALKNVGVFAHLSWSNYLSYSLYGSAVVTGLAGLVSLATSCSLIYKISFGQKTVPSSSAEENNVETLKYMPKATLISSNGDGKFFKTKTWEIKFSDINDEDIPEKARAKKEDSDVSLFWCEKNDQKLQDFVISAYGSICTVDLPKSIKDLICKVMPSAGLKYTRIKVEGKGNSCILSYEGHKKTSKVHVPLKFDIEGDKFIFSNGYDRLIDSLCKDE